MPYKLKPKEPVADGLKRVFMAELTALIRRMGNASAAGRDKRIHESRKGVKKLRAILKLVKAQIGEAYKKENADLKTIGRRLSVLRDEATLLKTLHSLRLPRETREPIIEHLNATSSQRTRKVNLKAAVPVLERMQKRVAILNFENDLSAGLQKSYERGRKALKGLKKGSEPDEWHAFRKRVKDHWYQVRLLTGVSHKHLKTRKEELKKLEKVLGVAQNLAVLRRVIGPLEEIEYHERKLHKEAKKQARGLYAARTFDA
jgi:CHAD domain-containing protein